MRQMAGEALQDLLADCQKQAAAFRFDALRKKVKNVKELREVRKQIARIRTIMKEKNI